MPYIMKFDYSLDFIRIKTDKNSKVITKNILTLYKLI
jgi:hypothetical protein